MSSRLLGHVPDHPSQFPSTGLKQQWRSLNESEQAAVAAARKRRIDRPLLRERPPSGWAVSGIGSHVGAGDHTGCPSDLMLRTVVRPTFGPRPPVWTRDGPVVAPRTWQLVCRAAGHGLGTAPIAGHGRVQVGGYGRSPASMATRRPVRKQRRSCRRTAGHVRCGRPACRPGSGHRRTLCRSGVTRQIRWLRKLVVGLAAAGGMQPAPVAARAGRSGGRGAGHAHRSSPTG
jgi:hypothetical protein